MKFAVGAALLKLCARRNGKPSTPLWMPAEDRYASAASNATKPILFEPMVMSILVSQQISLQRLKKEVEDLKAKQSGAAQQC